MIWLYILLFVFAFIGGAGLVFILSNEQYARRENLIRKYITNDDDDNGNDNGNGKEDKKGE